MHQNYKFSILKTSIPVSYFDRLTCEGLLLIKKQIFPSKDFIFKIKLEHKINHFLTLLNQLSNSNKINWALNLIEKLVFNFCIRIYIISFFKRQNLKDPFNQNLKLTNYNEALYFLKITQLKNMKKSKIFKVLLFNIKKKNILKRYRCSSILNQIWQKQFELLINSVIKNKLYKLQFGFKKNKSTLQFMQKFYNYLLKSNTNGLKILKINIHKYYDFFSHKIILKSFPWPEKFLRLFFQWLTPNLYNKQKKFVLKIKQGLLKESIFTPLISSFLLSICLQKTILAFKLGIADQKVEKKSVCLNFKNIIFFCHNKSNIHKLFLLSFILNLKIFNLLINKKKVILFSFLKSTKIKILGWIISFKLLISPKKDCNGASKNSKKQSISYWSIYPTNKSYTYIKFILKKIIQKLMDKPLWIVLFKLNLNIQKFSLYFNCFSLFIRLNSLYYFCYNLWKKNITRKFRYKGIKKYKQILTNFFRFNNHNTKPGFAWYQIGVKLPTRKFQLIWQTILLKSKNAFLLHKFKNKKLSYFFLKNQKDSCIFCLKKTYFNLKNLTIDYIYFFTKHHQNNLVLFHKWCHFFFASKKLN